VVQVGTGLSVSSGVLSVDLPDATTTSKGVVQVGTGLSVTDGVLRVPNATTTSKGVVQVGSGLSVTGGGILSVPVATAGVAGRVQPGNGLSVDGNGVLSVTAGESAFVASLTNTNSWSGIQQYNVSSAVVSTSSYTPASPSQGIPAAYLILRPTSNFTLQNFNFPVVGVTHKFIIVQDSVGSRLITFGSHYKFPGGITPTLTTTPLGIDILTIFVISAADYACSLETGFPPSGLWS
jgi:hypothetical protein